MSSKFSKRPLKLEKNQNQRRVALLFSLVFALCFSCDDSASGSATSESASDVRVPTTPAARDRGLASDACINCEPDREPVGCSVADCPSGNCVDGRCLSQVCGNGIVEGEEECDDGNPVDGDGCSRQCTVEGCGDGVVANQELDCDCPEGFRNADQDGSNGCECAVQSSEDSVCDGVDDDCDGRLDEDFMPPSATLGECQSDAPPCGLGGTRERTDFSCVEGEVVEAQRLEACELETEDLIVEERPWSECISEAEGCSPMGVQTRTVISCQRGRPALIEERRECDLQGQAGCADPISQGWTQYHTQIESCFPNYNGPQVTRFDVGDESFPPCSPALQGQVWCSVREDGSPSRCLFCEDNLYLCQ